MRIQSKRVDFRERSSIFPLELYINYALFPKRVVYGNRAAWGKYAPELSARKVATKTLPLPKSCHYSCHYFWIEGKYE